MPAFLIPIIAKILPFVLGAIALVGVWLGIKKKAAREEREKIQAAQKVAIEKQTAKVEAAISKDKAIDVSVGEKISEIKKSNSVPVTKDENPDSYRPGDIFKF